MRGIPLGATLLELVAGVTEGAGWRLRSLGNCQPLEELARLLVGHTTDIAGHQRFCNRTGYLIRCRKLRTGENRIRGREALQ